MDGELSLRASALCLGHRRHSLEGVWESAVVHELSGVWEVELASGFQGFRQALKRRKIANGR